VDEKPYLATMPERSYEGMIISPLIVKSLLAISSDKEPPHPNIPKHLGICPSRNYSSIHTVSARTLVRTPPCRHTLVYAAYHGEIIGHIIPGMDDHHSSPRLEW
jgi:hypothetical protein